MPEQKGGGGGGGGSISRAPTILESIYMGDLVGVVYSMFPTPLTSIGGAITFAENLVDGNRPKKKKSEPFNSEEAVLGNIEKKTKAYALMNAMNDAGTEIDKYMVLNPADGQPRKYSREVLRGLVPDNVIDQLPVEINYLLGPRGLKFVG